MLTLYGNLIRFMLTWQGSEEELDCPLIPVYREGPPGIRETRPCSIRSPLRGCASW